MCSPVQKTPFYRGVLDPEPFVTAEDLSTSGSCTRGNSPLVQLQGTLNLFCLARRGFAMGESVCSSMHAHAPVAMRSVSSANEASGSMVVGKSSNTNLAKLCLCTAKGFKR